MTERRKHLVLIALILAALGGVALLAIPSSPAHKKLTLGLDLRGGFEVVLKAVPPKGQSVTADGMSTAQSIMRSRVDSLGVSEPEVRRQGPDQIVIELAGVHDPAQAAQIIGKPAQLELYDFEGDLTGPSVSGLNRQPTPKATLYDLLSDPATTTLVKKNGANQWYLFTPTKVLRVGPEPSKDAVLRSNYVRNKLHGRIPSTWHLLQAPANTLVVSSAPTSGATGFYLFKHNPAAGIPEMTGKDLVLSGTKADFDPNTGAPIVTMQFTGRGKRAFQDITRTIAHRGRLVGGGNCSQSPPPGVQHFAIVLDKQIQSTPYIDYCKNPDGIPGYNGAVIDLGAGGTIGEAKQLALVLRTGALPYNFVPLERTDVSATLGKDSLNQAKRAAIVGLLIVAIFLLVLYRFLGLVAVIGLGIYAAFLYAAILLFNVTLTLPGFAGLILTIGVAADANVVVFERVKEEVRAGKSVRAAIGAGYAKGFHTILDANVVTAITALVLFAVATAQVKGFALMLLIGTVISLITSVAATRAMLGLLAGFRWFDNPRFMGAEGQQSAKWLQIDFMRRRYWWFAISGAVVVISVGALAIRGLNLGIDFKGGTQLTFKTTAPKSTGDIRNVMSADGYADAVIQGRGSLSAGRYTSFQVRTKTLSTPTLSKIEADLKNKVGAVHAGATSVSSSFGKQITHAAIYAIIVSLVLVVIYIAIRFDLKFAVPVIIAMLHDVLIAVGIYALSHREVTSSTVAAILTVLGYSIYDTIIIFDRIRENIPLMRRSSFATIANVSLWETIRRSLATTFITLLPVLSLFIFGGATLKDFAFALLVGITSGAYSSIFVAAPLLTTWKEREPEFAHRKGETVTKRGMEATLEAAEAAAAAEPAPAELAPVASSDGGEGADGADGAAAAAKSAAQAKRERRRQRRRARPHGRAR